MPDAETPPDVEAEVCADILRRQAAGVAKYGQTVAQNPLSLREWMQHAYEEALDFAIYLKRGMRQLPEQEWKVVLEPSDESMRTAHTDLQRKADAICGRPGTPRTLKSCWGLPLDEPPPATLPAHAEPDRLAAILKALKEHPRDYSFPVFMHPAWFERFPELSRWPDVARPMPQA